MRYIVDVNAPRVHVLQDRMALLLACLWLPDEEPDFRYDWDFNRIAAFRAGRRMLAAKRRYCEVVCG